jgi:hypothetical protein
VPIEAAEPRLPPSQVDAYVNVDVIRKNPSPKPLPRRAASVKQPVPAPRKKFGGSFKAPPVSAEEEPESTSLPLVSVKADGTASEPIENGPSGTHVSSQPVSGEDTVQPVSQEESSESVSRTNTEEPVSGGYSLEPVNKEDTPEPVRKTLDPSVLYTVVSPKKSSEEEPDVVTNGSTNSPGSAVDSGAVYAEISPIQDLQEDPSVPMPVYEEVPPAPIPSQGGPPSTGPPQDSKLIEPSVDVKKSSDDNVLVTHPDSNAAPDLPQSSTNQDNDPSPVSPQGMYEFVDISRELSVTSTTTAEQSSSTSTPTRDPPRQLLSVASSPGLLENNNEPESLPVDENVYESSYNIPNGKGQISRSVSTGGMGKHSTGNSGQKLTNTLPPSSATRLESLSPGTRKRLGTLTEMGESLLLSPAWARLNLDNQAPKTKQGWMEKRGGQRGEKPWQQRWFTFDEQNLRYFKTKNDKESEFKGEVRVSEMNDVKQVVDKDSKKPHRLDLMTSNRVFQLAAPSEEECLQWIAVLQGAIATFRPSEALEGGIFHNPDKSGWLQKQGHGAIKRWEKRYVALKGAKFAYYNSKEEFLAAKPIHVLESKLLNVRPDMSGSYRFTITTANKSYHFQAATDVERNEWVDSLRMSVLKGLDEEKGAPVNKNVPTSQAILERIYANESNRTCADCTSANPVWASVNLCLMLCIDCSGVHRALGVHISKVRSAELDKSIWTDSLVDLMVALGNSTANRFWEHHLQQEKLDAEVERDIREAFIRAKYETKAWIPRVGDDKVTLSKALCVSVTTPNVQRSYELICSGADVKFEHPSPRNPEQNTPLLIAKGNDEILQAELIRQHLSEPEQNGTAETTEGIHRRGYLSKTGGDRTGWKKRFCTLNSDGFRYYKDESCSEEQGVINPSDMLSVSVIDDDSLTQGSAKYFQFEVTTVSRGYLLGADLEQDRMAWVSDFERLIPRDAADGLGFDKVGYMQLNYKLPPAWRPHWFTLKGKELSFYKRGEEKETLDLKKMTNLKGPEKSSAESLCTIHMIFPQKTHILRTNTPLEAEVWFEALRHTQVSGIPLKDQQTTNYGVPIIVHKCIQFVEARGMDVEGIYRHSGQRAKIQKLTLEFNQDAKGVVIDADVYNVHDVTGCLKQFFRSLPDPLLTHQLYESLIATSQMTDHENQLYQIQSLIDQLPPVNHATLKRVIGHLNRIKEQEEKNKMGLNNIVKIFGPTLMTVDGDTISFQNSCHEFKVISILISYYQWLFQVDDEEMKKEQAMAAAMKRLKQAAQQQLESRSSFTATFIVTVFVQHKDGDSCNLQVSQLSTVAEVTEQVATLKCLPPDSYALYLVIGDAVSERFIHPSERVLAVIQNITSDHYLCIKPNTMASVLRGHLQPNKEPVSLYVKEKKKWSKKLHAAAVLAKDFVLYKDPRLYKNEVFRSPVDEFDLYIGFAPDVKCPAPTRYQFCLRARTEDKSKYFCADTELDLFIIIGALTHAKFPDGITTPIVPQQPTPPEDVTPGGNSPTSQARTPMQEPDYLNIKLKPKSGR